MSARLVLPALVLAALVLAACRTEPRSAPTPTIAETATSTPSTVLTPTPTSAFVDVVFCRDEADRYFFERCPSGPPGDGFVATLSRDELPRFPMGGRLPACMQPEPSAETYRAIVDEPCAHNGLMKDGLRPVPMLIEGIPLCQMDEVMGSEPPLACVVEEGILYVLARDAAIDYMARLAACGAELEAFADLRDLHEPVIAALQGLETNSDLAPLRVAAQPVLDYEFDPLVPPSTEGARELHGNVLAAIEPVLGGEVAAAEDALKVVTESHYFYGRGRGCSG